MPTEASRTLREVLILAPAGHDASSIERVLARQRLRTTIVNSLAELAARVGAGAGAVVMTSEALLRQDATPLLAALDAQPTWSDLPFVYLGERRTGRPLPGAGLREALPPQISHVMVLERPLGADTLVSAVEWALAARSRQFQVADHMRALAERAEELRGAQQALKDSETELRRSHAELETLVAERTAALHAEMQERAQAEEALRQSQKMEAVGQLTGGIAHDFNNLLQGITGSLAVIKKRLDAGRPQDLERFIGGAMKSAQRAASLTHRLLAFSRRQPLDAKPAEVNPLVDAMQDLLQRTLGEHVALSYTLAPDLWLTLCDANQLESSLLNLAINARDAMPGGGWLSIVTRNAHFEADDSELLTLAGGAAPGDYVCVSVTDTGQGMSRDVIARAFDPFFTTKPIGQGTGLGLSMIYGFARQSQGFCKIDSEVGRGTTISIYLPRTQPDDGAAEPEAMLEPDGACDTAARLGDVVLVVEDDEIVRGLVVEALREAGYQALQAVDGPTGLDLLRSNARIDLLLTDVGLPGLNGRQVADAARELRPQLKVLLMTGYAENAAIPSGFLAPGMALITKPFAIDSLAARVREIMQSPVFLLPPPSRGADPASSNSLT